jgi:hypothetical protein
MEITEQIVVVYCDVFVEDLLDSKIEVGVLSISNSD